MPAPVVWEVWILTILLQRIKHMKYFHHLGEESKFSSVISQELLKGTPALSILFRMMIKDDPKHLAAVVVGVSGISYDAAYFYP